MSNLSTPETTTEPIATPTVIADDIVSVLNKKLEEDPTDILSALELIKHYESKDDFEQIKLSFEKLHSRFPFYAPLWSIHLKEDLQRDEFETVEKLLAQCLSGETENNDLSLWMTYLDYVRRKNNLITGGQEARAIVVKAFDLVLEKCAIFEPNSSQFWNDYVLFLEQWKPVNKWEEQQKIDMIRTLYKRMLCVPFNSLEQMWNKYTQWEQTVNSLTARKFIGELSGDYMKARSLYQEWSNVTKGLRRVAPINLRSVNKKNLPHTSENEEFPDQIDIWKKWIEWEKENKLVLPEETAKMRVSYAYKQSIIYMLFSPEIWYNYAISFDENDSSWRQQTLSHGLKANPTSPTLCIKLSEIYGMENEVEMIKSCFEGTIKSIQRQYKKSVADDNSESAQSLKERLGYIYCVYMNTVKKISGLSAARSIFGKCRKLKDSITHQIYIENAYMEYYNQNDGYKTALKVLELGLKYFQTDGQYINKYIDFLLLFNKDSQIKTLFESSIDKIDDKIQTRLIFKKMIEYETKYGNISTVYTLEKRYKEKFPDEMLIETFSDRYMIQKVNQIKKLELPYLYNETEEAAFTFGTDRNLKRTREDFGNGSNKRFHGNMKTEIPEPIVNLLKILPKRQYFKNAILDPSNLVDYLINQIEIPNDTNVNE
ncbi:cleavage polyadenylation factor subunit RNA14 [Maudiozyma barnettii]|uniref:mRNA 3'-end-processing protein RNA14 n=1 Tax=Maudiozyma barnettii TaxID=61262 RepID=A0A8H2VJQ2_9SACH|nr:cleavage polyadenylation factor subunit RNA14 [Kazachstania barnettii]CAB4256671.1 similar to Saccharomyces cerevisiae YMR061W RNA14 Cleavage and polyadenylation factor I (CF I) component [Kazachstania barnettii]